MKKLLSFIMTIVILSTLLCFSVSASETSTEKTRLKLLIDYVNNQRNMLGGAVVYENNVYRLLDSAKEVYTNADSTDEDYREVYSAIITEKYNGVILTDYARATVEMAEKEQNYNNWYSDEDWELYQEKTNKLRVAVDDYDDTYTYFGEIGEDGQPIIEIGYKYTDEQKQAINTAFHELLYVLNSITNKEYIKGDIDGDGEVTISDATLIQKYLCGLADLTISQKMRCYLSGSTSSENSQRSIIISDAVQIQKYISGIITNFNNYQIFLDEVDSYEEEEFLKSHLINYFICPGRQLPFGSMIHEGYYITQDMQEFYKICEQNGIDYKI